MPSRAGDGGVAPRRHTVPRFKATGGPPRRAHSRRTASFRRAATYRGAGGGIGLASGRLYPANP